jgi:hypothetical protein
MPRWTPWHYVIDVHVHETLLHAMLLHTPLVVKFRHCIVTHCELGSFDMISLVRVGFSSKQQIGFN